ELPDDIFNAVVGVLKEWDWSQRPVAVAAVESRTRPRLVSSLARRIAQVGRLTDLGNLTRVGGGAPGAGAESNSVQRLAAVWDALRIPPEMAAALPELDGPVLLVDDVIDSGWTVTVAARALRLARAPGVLPFALATAG